MSSASRILAATALSLTLGTAWAQDAGWPRVVKNGKTEIVIYQPQPDSLEGVTLQSRVAVSIKRPEEKTPLFGALWVIATLGVDRDQDLAHVVSIKIDRTRFADVPDSDVQSLVQFLQNDMPRWDLSLSLTRLRATLQAADAGPQADFKNDPPKVIVMDSPAILLLLDGEPRLQDVGSSGLQQVVNTALPVIFDTRSRQYWFYGSSVWFTTKDLLRGNWTAADRAPDDIADLVKDTETLDAAQSDAGKQASPEQLRSAKIVVATEPTELIVTDGAPKYSPLVGGDILYVTNTDSDIFMEVGTQRHFIVISGRWFAGRSIQGPWSFISPETLPKAFASIPENSAKANDLAFVPGTDRAKDAVMDTVIPQTAEVSRKDASIEVQYDGAPQFSRIPNTQLDYAENTPSQVIRAAGKYYACEDGVWYVAPSPSGPWSVSEVRPVGVDDIPPSSPVYNTKYVYIYDSTPEFVYVGYLPGYRWSFPHRGVVFYGTGWRYRGWYRRYYYPRATTWGFYVRYNPWSGWNFGMSWTAGWLSITSRWGSGWAGWRPVYGPGYRPGFWSGIHAGGWFGPGGYRPPRPAVWRPVYRPGPRIAQVRPGGRPGNNLYNRPGNVAIRPRPATLPQPARPNRRLPNNVYSDRDGALHRDAGGRWETRDNRTWKREGTPPPTARPAPAPSPRPQPQPRPSIRTEPRGGGSMPAERDARNRGERGSRPRERK